MSIDLPFCLLSLFTVAGAVAAMSLRNLVHCALAAALCFVGLAGFYLRLGAEFAGFAQLLVYVGAVAILIVFTILLTHGADVKSHPGRRPPPAPAGLAAAALLFGALVWTITASPALHRAPPPDRTAPVKDIGVRLLADCLIPLETTALILTATLIGAAVVAMRDEPEAAAHEHEAHHP